MKSMYPEFDLLLPSVDPFEGEMARDLLSAEGLPSILRGPDFDAAELGTAAHAVLRHQDLFVPRGTHAAARAILVEAWGEERVAELEARADS